MCTGAQLAVPKGTPHVPGPERGTGPPLAGEEMGGRGKAQYLRTQQHAPPLIRLAGCGHVPSGAPEKTHSLRGQQHEMTAG